MWYGRDTSTSKAEMVVDGMFTLSVGCLHSRVGLPSALFLRQSRGLALSRTQLGESLAPSARIMPLFGQLGKE